MAYGTGRRKNWNLICRLFTSSEVGDVRSLFPVELKMELVMAVVVEKRLGVVMKRSDKVGFELVATKVVAEGGEGGGW